MSGDTFYYRGKGKYILVLLQEWVNKKLSHYPHWYLSKWTSGLIFQLIDKHIIFSFSLKTNTNMTFKEPITLSLYKYSDNEASNSLWQFFAHLNIFVGINFNIHIQISSIRLKILFTHCFIYTYYLKVNDTKIWYGPETGTNLVKVD